MIRLRATDVWYRTIRLRNEPDLVTALPLIRENRPTVKSGHLNPRPVHSIRDALCQGSFSLRFVSCLARRHNPGLLVGRMSLRVVSHGRP